MTEHEYNDFIESIKAKHNSISNGIAPNTDGIATETYYKDDSLEK